MSLARRQEPPAPVVRAAMPDDHDACARIFLESRRRAFFWLDPLSLSLADYLASVQDEDVWVAERQGEVVGFASVFAADSFVHNLFIDPALRRQGIGRLLLSAVSARYPRPLRLKCVAENLAARRFYRAMGWSEEERGVDDGTTYILFRY